MLSVFQVDLRNKLVKGRSMARRQLKDISLSDRSIAREHDSNDPFIDISDPSAIREMDAIALLRRLTHNAAAEWRTPYQWIAIQHILAWKTDLLIVMPTGSGKTVVTLIPTLMDGDVTVYILPLNSLIMDYKRRLDDMKIAYDHFTGTNPQLRQDVSIILVSVDRAVTNHWKHCITNLNDKRAVTRLVLDEAHIALSAHDYRNVFKMLAYLRCLGFQIILLSGSIPPVATQHIRDIFRLHPIQSIVLRMPTDRPELEYIRLSKINNNDDMINKVKSLITRSAQGFDPKDRVIVFVAHKSVGEAVADALGCDFYKGDIKNEDERLQMYRRWWTGYHKVLVATQALGAGNDYPAVRTLFHVGTPYEMLNFVQEVSRAGRDGRAAVCYLIPSSRKEDDNVPPPDYKGIQAMSDHVLSPSLCARYSITSFCDDQGTYCADNPSSQKCGFCRRLLDMRAPLPLSGHPPIVPQWPHPTFDREMGETGAKRKVRPQEGTPFSEQVERVKRERLDKEDVSDEYVERFRNALMIFQPNCAFCALYDVATRPHALNQCHEIQRLNKWFSFVSFRNRIRYNKTKHGGVCYLCHVPQCNDKLHRMFKDKNNCDYPDIIAPISFCIFEQKDLKNQGEKYFKVKWNVMQDYLDWINGPVIEGAQTNLSEIFLWYVKLTHGL